MKSKKEFYFDEVKNTKEIVSKGFDKGNIDYGLMYSVAKYFRQEFGYGEITLEKELISFCKKQNKDFNPIIEAQTIKKWIKAAMRYGLREVSRVSISPEEISFLKGINIPKDRKILFITLILSRTIKQNNIRLKKRTTVAQPGYFIHYSNFPDIIKLSNIANLSETKLADIFGKYKEHMTFYTPEKELIRLDFASIYSSSWIILKNLENIAEEYVFLFGKNKAICKQCGAEIVKKSNRQVTCQKCAREIRSIKQRELMRKRRANTNVSI